MCLKPRLHAIIWRTGEKGKFAIKNRESRRFDSHGPRFKPVNLFLWGSR